MLKKSLLSMFGLLVVVALIITFAPATHAEQGGSENFIFVNFIGREIFLDLDDVTYTIPGTDIVPEGGRLVLQLAVGEHKYAANIPGGPGSAGEFTISPGGFVAKAVRLGRTEVPVDRNGIVVGDVKDYVDVFDFNPFAAPVEEVPVVDTWQPTAPATGMGRIAWINYYGRDELVVDLNGQLYKVPPQTNGIPGRLEIDVSPGFYRYTVSVPNGSLNGEVMVVAGQITGLGISANLPEPVEYDIGDEFEFLPPVTLRLAEEDLTGQVQASQPDSAPATLPATGGQVAPTVLDTTTKPEGLLVKNYTGDTLVFTINHQTYMIVDNAERTVSLPPGRYNYTASLPFVATTGTVDLALGQSVELSVAINVNHDLLSVYQN